LRHRHGFEKTPDITVNRFLQFSVATKVCRTRLAFIAKVLRAPPVWRCLPGKINARLLVVKKIAFKHEEN
jgi:hypothetical protein